MKALKIAGWVTVAAIAFSLWMTYPDLRRYIKIEMM